MATSKQDLWLHVKDENFAKAEEIIKKNPELVNSIHETGNSLLMYLLFTSSDDEAREFIKFVLTHPRLDIQYAKTEKLTNIYAIITFQKPEILRYVIHHPAFLVSGQKLTYEIVKNCFETSSKLHTEQVFARPQDLELVKQYNDEMLAYKQMLPMLRDATIRHAVETDNVDWMQHLKIAGAALAIRMSDGKTASELVNRRPGKVYEWLKKEGLQESPKLQHNLSLFANSNAERARIEPEKKGLEENNVTAKKSCFSQVFGKYI